VPQVPERAAAAKHSVPSLDWKSALLYEETSIESEQRQSRCRAHLQITRDLMIVRCCQKQTVVRLISHRVARRTV